MVGLGHLGGASLLFQARNTASSVWGPAVDGGLISHAVRKTGQVTGHDVQSGPTWKLDMGFACCVNTVLLRPDRTEAPKSIFPTNHQNHHKSRKKIIGRHLIQTSANISLSVEVLLVTYFNSFGFNNTPNVLTSVFVPLSRASCQTAATTPVTESTAIS